MSLRNRSYLTEATFNIKADVDRLYKMSGFGKLHGLLKKGDYAEIKKIFAGFETQLFLDTSSRILRSKISKQAHKVNPVSIRIGVSREGSYYKPGEAAIQVSLNHHAISLLKNFGYMQQNLKQAIGDQYLRFVNEFDAEGVKATISHELSHWISDSLYSQNVAKHLKIAREMGGYYMGDYGGKFPSVRQHPMEIDAQIHGIKEVQRQIGKRAYNKMTWLELFHMKGSLLSNFKAKGNRPLFKKEYESMIKRFAKRLHREGLLGNGMRKLPTHAQMLRYLKRM